MKKHYISPQQLLQDSFQLGWDIYASGFRPTFVVGVWRGGTPVGIAIHELLSILGVESDHTAIRTTSYQGMRRVEQPVRVDGLDYLSERLTARDRVLLADDVHDTGLSLEQVVAELRASCGENCPEIRIATPWFKPTRNRSQLRPDYFIHTSDDWLVFPHELEGLSAAEIQDHKPELAALLTQLEGKLGKR